MLTDPEEIEIISRAGQKNVRDPNRSRQHFEHIFEDFFSAIDFSGKELLDLGPGQFDFGVIARERGALTYNIDKDPAVVELGKHKNFPVVQGNLQDIGISTFGKAFDGVFCKYSIDAFWFIDSDEQQAYIERLAALVKPGGWAWIAPWNGISKNIDTSRIQQTLATQIESFTRHGFIAYDLTKNQSAYYGVHGRTANRALFCLNLENAVITNRLRRLPPEASWSVRHSGPDSRSGFLGGLRSLLSRIKSRIR